MNAERHLPASPHGAIEPVFDGIWFVRGSLKMPMRVPMRIGRAMTVVRGADGLALFNSMRLTEEGLADLTALGEVKHVVRLAGFHGRDDGFYRDRFGARVHAIEGQRYVRSMNPGDASERSYMEPDEWLTEGSALPIVHAKLKIFETSSPPEAVCVLERDGGILIAGDSLQHTPAPDEHFNFLAKLAMKKMGFFQPHNVGPGWLRFARPTAEDVCSVLDLEFDHVLPGHGAPVLGGAKAKFRPAVEAVREGGRR
jgi:hypothetical protein